MYNYKTVSHREISHFVNNIENVFGKVLLSEYNIKYLLSYYENKEAELKKRSSVYWPEKLCKSSSLLILSGLNDNRQNPEQARVFTKKLDSLNYKYVLKEVETDHFFSDQKPYSV